MRAITAVLITVALAAPFRAYAQTPAPTPAPAEPAASPAPSPGAGGIDLSKLTPEQQGALQASIIKASQNPVGNIAIIPFQQNFNYGVGPYTRFQYNLNIQPVVPFMLSPNLNLIARTIIPIINQPSFAPPQVCASQFGCGSTFGISDIQEQIFFAPKTKPGELIWGVGPQFLFPTASPDTLGTGKWSVGPAVVGLVMPGPFVMGVLVTQLWSFAGKANFPDVNTMSIQPFINYNLKGGWAITTAPILAVNWTAAQNKWAIPLGAGVSKTFKLGDQPMQLAALYYTYVERPVTTPQTNLKVTWSLLFPIKRGIDMQQLLQQSK